MTSDTDVKRVDDIWAALKNKSGATADTQRRAELALASSRTSDVPSTSRPSAAPSNANSVAKYLDASLAKLLPQNPIPSAARAAGKPAAAMPLANAPPHSIPSSLPSPASSELIPSGPISLQKEIDTLHNSTLVGSKRASLAIIRRFILGELSDPSVADPDKSITKALLRRLADPTDTIRETAADLLLLILQHKPDASPQLMPYITPVVIERLVPPEANAAPSHGPGSIQDAAPLPLVEPSEEVRARLLALMLGLAGAIGPGIAAYAGELAEIVRVCAHDPSHVCLGTVCQLAALLSAQLGRRLMQGAMAKHLVAAVAPLTAHRRASVRCAASAALGPLITEGAHEMILEICAFIDPNYVPVKAFYQGEIKANYLGKMATDTVPQARLSFLAHCLDPWMTAMVERKDHESRLLPYVLGFLHDDDPSIATAACALLDRLGAQYEADHEEELRERRTYLAPELLGMGRLTPGVARALEGAGPGTDLPPPPPFTGRPRLGTRILCQENLGRFSHALAKEITTWQEGPRRHASLLLEHMIFLCEDHVSCELHRILPAVLQALQMTGVPATALAQGTGAAAAGELQLQQHVTTLTAAQRFERDMAQLLHRCLRRVGLTVDPSWWSALILTKVRGEDESGSPQGRVAALEALGSVLSGLALRGAVSAAERPKLSRAFLEVAEALGTGDVRVRGAEGGGSLGAAGAGAVRRLEAAACASLGAAMGDDPVLAEALAEAKRVWGTTDS